MAALLRISDEIDVVATRNPILVYDRGAMTQEFENVENKMLYSITQMKLTRDAFVMIADTNDPEVLKRLEDMIDRMQSNLDYCRDVIEECSSFNLTQQRVVLQIVDREDD